MALPLESEVMRDIGLGNHYNWFNGSGSCGGIARAAAEKIGEAIKRRHRAGEEIAAPVPALIVLVTESLRKNGSDYSLTKTWQVASDVIQTHIHLAHANDAKQMVAQMERSIRDAYGLTAESMPHRRNVRTGKYWPVI